MRSGWSSTQWTTAPARSRNPGLRRQLREGLGDGGEESLGLGFLFGDAALVVLEVAQGGLGEGLGAAQEVALTGWGGFSLESTQVHDPHAMTCKTSVEVVTGAFA